MQSKLSLLHLLVSLWTFSMAFSAPLGSLVTPSPASPQSPSQPMITLYPHSDFRGQKTVVIFGSPECSESPSDDISSITVSSGSCVKLFTNSGCTGASVLVSTSQANLIDQGINDQVRSFRKCRSNESP